METNRNILAIGAILVAGGITTSVISFDPTPILKYIFIGVSVIISVPGFRVWQHQKNRYPKSHYYLWLGCIVLALAISLGIWATLNGFINVLGFFLILLGFIELCLLSRYSYMKHQLPGDYLHRNWSSAPSLQQEPHGY